MIYRLLADSVLVVHLAFILFAVLGALLVLYQGWWRYVHVPALLWALAVEFFQLNCPLTALENTLRHTAGEEGYAGGFIEHYLLPVIYPPGLDAAWQMLLGSTLLVWNLVLYAIYWRKSKR